jgi:hypothetical protein
MEAASYSTCCSRFPEIPQPSAQVQELVLLKDLGLRFHTHHKYSQQSTLHFNTANVSLGLTRHECRRNIIPIKSRAESSSTAVQMCTNHSICRKRYRLDSILSEEELESKRTRTQTSWLREMETGRFAMGLKEALVAAFGVNETDIILMGNCAC